MKRWIAGIVYIFSVILFSISLYFLMGMFIEERADSQTYDEITAIYEEGTKGDEEKEVDDVMDETVGSSEDTNTVNAGLLALHEENSDCVGWITIDGTVIDYPVMYHPQEKNYYLRRDFYGEYSANGSLFISENCNPTESDNQIIYGHHMNSGKMFAALDEYESEAFYKEHSTIRYSTLEGDEIYQIIAAFTTPVYTGKDFQYYGFSKAKSAAEYQKYISECQKRAFYETGYTAKYGDKLITLSTCEYSQRNGRMVVVAKRVEGGESLGGA